jgi:hypothetical protein
MYLLYMKQQNSMSKDKAFSDKWRVSFLILLHRQPYYERREINA